jgi:hypothetical protein
MRDFATVLFYPDEANTIIVPDPGELPGMKA